MAYLDQDGKFCKSQDPYLSKALEEGGRTTFTNQAKRAHLTCVKCCQKLYRPGETDSKDPYYWLSAAGQFELSSRWQNARKAAVKVKISSKKLCNILQQIERSVFREYLRNGTNAKLSARVLHAKYMELVEKGGMPATDWVCKLGRQTYILYVCIGCNIAPIAANMWFRCAKSHLVYLRDQYGGETTGHWRCGACLKRCKPGQADKFIAFVIGNAQHHFMGCLGDAS